MAKRDWKRDWHRSVLLSDVELKRTSTLKGKGRVHARHRQTALQKARQGMGRGSVIENMHRTGSKGRYGLYEWKFDYRHRKRRR